jgi:hypothetical protein
MLSRFPRIREGSQSNGPAGSLIQLSCKVFGIQKKSFSRGLTRMNAGSQRNRSKYIHSLRKLISPNFLIRVHPCKSAAKIRLGLKPRCELEYTRRRSDKERRRRRRQSPLACFVNRQQAFSFTSFGAKSNGVDNGRSGHLESCY